VLNAIQLERATVKPLAENKYRTRETDAALRNATAELTRKYAATAENLANFGVLDIQTFDALADEPIEIRAKAQQIVNDQLDRGVVPQWLSAIEQVKQSRQSGGSSGASSQAGGGQAPDNTKLFEELELIESRIATNPTPELMMRQDQLKQQISQVEGPKQYQNKIEFVNRKLGELRDLMQTPETLIASGYTNPITGAPIQSIEEAQDAENRLIARRQKSLVELRNAGPEYWEGLPSPETFQYKSTLADATNDLKRLGIKNVSPKQHLASMRMKEWRDFEKSQGEGFIYVAPNAQGQMTVMETTPVRTRVDREAISADNPLLADVAAEEAAGLRQNEANMRSQITAAENRIARLSDTTRPMEDQVSPTQTRQVSMRERAVEIENLRRQISALKEKLSRLQ
jgi:hypothetical protein